MPQATATKTHLKDRILALVARRNGARTDPMNDRAHSLSLVAHNTGLGELRIIAAPAKRKWMDATATGFANRCLPLLMANQWGWFIENGRKIELNWNGGPAAQDLHVQYWKKHPGEHIDPERLLVVSHFGHGILTFRIPYVFQTPPDWNLYVRGPANCFKDGAHPLDGIVETDWSSVTFTMNWKITRPGASITFDEGEPICQIFPVPRGSVEAFVPQICNLSESPERECRYKEWKRSREELYRTSGNSGEKSLWQMHYLRGMSILGEIFTRHQTRLAVREFQDLRDAGAKPPANSKSTQAND